MFHPSSFFPHPSSFPLLLAGALIGLAANLAAEGFLSLEMKLPYSTLTGRQRVTRMIRWMVIAGGCAAVAALQGEGGLWRAVVFGLFSVTAATDLETTLIPPDWFTWGATVAGALAGLAEGGLPGLRQAIIAQAVCFAVMTLAVVLFAAAAPGDIKLAAQYGAAAGALGAVAIAFVAEWVIRALLVAGAFAVFSRRSGPRAALDRVIALRIPHGPFAWLGLCVALGVAA